MVISYIIACGSFIVSRNVCKWCVGADVLSSQRKKEDQEKDNSIIQYLNERQLNIIFPQ